MSNLNAMNENMYNLIDMMMQDDLSDEKLNTLVKKAGAITQVASQVIDSERVLNDRVKIITDYAPQKLVDDLLPVLIGGSKND